jgi:hypothetical protein
MSSAEEREQWQALAEAATPGPWHWFGNTKTRQIGLGWWRKGWGRCTVMDFTRWGMQSAQPRFSDDHAMMHDASGMAVWEVNRSATDPNDPSLYRHDVVGIRHPDAAFIAAAREAVPALLADLEAAERERDEWKARRDNAVETCRFRHQEGLTAEQWHTKICGAMQGAQRERERAEQAEAERDAWRESAADLGRRLNKAEYDRDEEQYENQRLRDGIEASAVECLSIAASAARSQGEPDSDIADATLRSLSRRAKAVRDHLRALLAEDGAS